MDWNNLYRPNTLSEVLGQDHVIPKLQEIIKRIHNQGGDGSMPNLLFHGMRGTGKTSTVIAFLKDLFGKNYKENLLHLNASDERTLATIREKVKKFAKKTVIGTYFVNGEERLQPFKIILLEEADYLHHDAQPALRTIMEEYIKSTRFIMTCNYLHRIISPVQDRCSSFRFYPLKANELKIIANKIIEKEDIEISPKTLSYLCKNCEGSVRGLQHVLYQASLNEDMKVRRDEVENLVGGKVGEFAKKSFELLGDAVEDYSKFQDIDLLVDKYMRELGVGAEEMLVSIYDYIDKSDMPPKVKGEMFAKLGNSLERINVVEYQDVHVKLFFRLITI